MKRKTEKVKRDSARFARSSSRTFFFLFPFSFFLFLPASATLAQQPGGNEQVPGAAADVPGAAALPAVYRSQAYPPPPGGLFFRGNSTNPRQAGFYLSLWKFAFVLAVFLLWAWSSHWVDDDSQSLKVRPVFWNSLVFGCGFVGLVSVVFTPVFLVGFFVLLVPLYSVPLGLYIKERNQRVPDSAKVMTPEHIQSVITRELARIGIHIGREDVEDAAIGPPIKFMGKSDTGHDVDLRSRQVEHSKGYLATKELVYDAILRRSTDIHLEPKENELSVRLRIDGVMYPTEPFDRVMGDAVVNIFKVLGAMDITERRRPLDGSFRAELEGREIDFRIATQGTRHGQKLSLRILDQANAVSSLVGLGIRKQLLEQLRQVVKQPHGMLISCGPTGAGKSTTLYAALNELDAYMRNIITIEDPIEYKMHNVNQIEINTRSGQTFANSLRSILRQDPDVVMIGEIRDAETAKIACQAANTGHMVFSTLHANDTITALYRMLELDVESFMIANSISAILGQRLARRLCPTCKEAYRPRPELLKKAGLPAEKIDKFYRPPKNPQEVCTTCGGLGFRGRIGVFELLPINDRIRDMIRDKSPMSALKAEARKNGMLYMKEEGLRLVVRGITSIDEMLRVVK